MWHYVKRPLSNYCSIAHMKGECMQRTQPLEAVAAQGEKGLVHSQLGISYVKYLVKKTTIKIINK